MSYKCEVCEKDCDENWCDSCDKVTPIVHECEIEDTRQDICFGNGWTARTHFRYCDECGWNDV